MYVLFDARARGGVGGFDAETLEMDDSLAYLREAAKDYGGGAIYKFDQTANGELLNEQFVEDV